MTIDIYLVNMLAYGLACAPFYALGRVLYCRKKGRSAGFWGEALRLVFFIYLIGLLSQTILPDWNFSQTDGLYVLLRTGEVNLVPFHTIKLFFRSGYNTRSLINLLGNVVMFAPLGFVPPLLWRKWHPFPKMLLFSAAFPLFIEIEQHFIGRSSDIDDLLLNAAGILLGWAVWRAGVKNQLDSNP